MGYNWIGLTTIEDFLETKDVLMYGTDAEGVYFGRKHIDVYSMKRVERGYTPDYEASPEVKVGDFQDLLAELFGSDNWERVWEEFEKWRSKK